MSNVEKLKGKDYDFAIVDEYEEVVEVDTKDHIDYGDCQKIHYGFVCLEENLDESIFEVTEKLKDFVVVGLDSVILLPENNTHPTKEPIWVTNQKSKQFKRGKK